MIVKKKQFWKSKIRGIIIEIISQSSESGKGGQHWNIRQKNGKIHHISELAIQKQFFLLS